MKRVFLVLRIETARVKGEDVPAVVLEEEEGRSPRAVRFASVTQ